jgi:hypothetical protein
LVRRKADALAGFEFKWNENKSKIPTAFAKAYQMQSFE